MLLSMSTQGEDITSHETAVIFFMTEESRVVALCATSGVCQYTTFLNDEVLFRINLFSLQ